jgi:hypothetical protein
MNIPAMSSLTSLGSMGGTQGASSSGNSAGSISNAYYDIKDLNKDGTVSAREELIYAMTHPSGAGSQNRLTQYNATGSLNATHETAKFINTDASLRR